MSRSSGPVSDVPAQRFRRLRPGDEVESPTLPLPPPRDRAELERLITAVALAPAGERELIIETVAGFEERDQVADLLHEALFELPVRDVGRHGMVLSLIGELRHRSSVEELDRFVWLDDEQILPPDAHEGESGGADCHFEPFGALQARAAEMLVWVSRGVHLERVRRILYEHPDTQVRVAAIDACAYATGDDPLMLGALREIARVQDHWAVGLPRRSATRDGDFDVAAFDAAVLRHLREFGSVPELPELAEPDPESHDDQPRGQ